MLAALASVAWAGSLFVDVGPETHVDADRSGNWARIFPAADGGWDWFFASGGEYLHLPLDATFEPDLTRLTRLTGRSDLVDHAITRCEDGTWLHLGSRSVASVDDSLSAFRYDADFSRIAEATLYEQEPGQVHRDMPVLCAGGRMATAAFDPDAFVGFRYVELDEALAIVREEEPDRTPIMTGSSLFWNGREIGTVGFPGNFSDYLWVSEFDPDTLALMDRHLQNVSPYGLTAYWSQGVVRVGNHWVVAHMMRDDTAGWIAQDGDVWLSVFNLDWRFEEQVQVSTNTPPNGGMQPWVAFDGVDTLVVSYTRELEGYVFSVTIDPVEAGLVEEPGDTGDTAGDTSAPGSDTGDEPSDTGARVSGPPCGCRDGSALLLVPLVPALRRRRSP